MGYLARILKDFRQNLKLGFLRNLSEFEKNQPVMSQNFNFSQFWIDFIKILTVFMVFFKFLDDFARNAAI